LARLFRNFSAIAIFVVALTLATGATALAGGTMRTPTTGQPGAPTNTCGTANPVTPGGSANSPGSPFNPNGQAGVVYAGNPGTASLAHSNSTATVSQYDAACVRLSSH
jgi:hypothetical protein